MCKLLIFVLIFIGSYSNVRSQYKIVEGELGLSYPLGTQERYSAQSYGKSLGVYAEVRFNIPTTNFSLGSQFSRASWEVTAYDSRKSKATVYAFTTLFDYNADLAKNLQVFVGAGFGFSVLDKHAKVFISPRIGIEAWTRLRLSLNYSLTDQSYGGFVCRLGIVLGGEAKGKTTRYVNN